MKKPEINFGKVAYVPTPEAVLDSLQQQYGQDDNGEVHVGGVVLEEFESDNEEIEKYIQSVVEQAGDCDIIFHR